MLSLARFFSLLNRGQCSSRVDLAGVCRVAGPCAVTLTGQGCSVDVTGLTTVPADGSHVVISFLINDFEPLNERSGKVTRMIELNVMKAGAHADCYQPPAVNSGQYEQWLSFRHQVRKEMVALGLLEVETPSLVISPCFESTLEPIVTNCRAGEESVARSLPTSPELHLKKLLAAGFTDVFEMRTCFRNELPTPNHQPEFTMLEWYRCYADLDEVEKDLVKLWNAMINSGWNLTARAANGFTRRSVSSLFMEALGVELTPQTSRQELLQLALDCELKPDVDESWLNLYHWLWVGKVERHIDPLQPTIVYDYPPQCCALARINAEGWAERFEFYYNGLEIANAFGELTDIDEHESRWQLDMESRRRDGLSLISKDVEFFAAIKSGIPESAGIALGVERLFMALTKTKSMKDFKPFAIY